MQGSSKSMIPNAALSILLFTITIFVNKYVLSELMFQYPTIFQGWQTLIGVVMFRMMVMTGYIQVDLAEISRYQFLLWLPAMVLFVLSIYSGSVALSHLPVPVFLCLHSVLLLCPLLWDISLQPQKYNDSNSGHPVHILAGMGISLSAVMICLTDNQSRGTGYSWMIFHLVTLAALYMYKMAMAEQLEITEFHQTFLNYALSVVILTPSTVLLGDAMAAREFAFWYYYRFYVGCIISGVCGILVTLHTLRMKEQGATWTEVIPAVAKTVACILSWQLFSFQPTTANTLWILMNLSCGVSISIPAEDNTHTRERHRLISCNDITV